MNKIALAEELRGDRILLRKHEAGLAEKMFRSVDKDRERLRRYLPWVDFTRTVEDEINYIEMTLEAWSNRALFDYGMFRVSDGAYLGNCGAHSIAWAAHSCHLGYWIIGEFEGQGYMSEAVRTLEAELFDKGFNRIEIRCAAKNLRSAAVPRRNGYALESVVRREGSDVGDERDTLVFAKIREMQFDDAADAVMGFRAAHVILFTNDLNASREFYRKAFGIAPHLDQPELCEFLIEGQSLVLHPADEKSPAGTDSQIAYWPVPDFAAAVERFQSLGGAVFRGPLEVGDGEKICQVRDPYGNCVGLRGR